MGKVAAAIETKWKKKKGRGRPSLLDLQKRALEQQQQQQQALPTSFNRRSTRRNPNPDLLDDDDDDERKQKKVKLVLRLPQSNQHSPPRLPRSSPPISASNGADSNAVGGDPEASIKKTKISAGSGDTASHQGEKAPKATDTLYGLAMESGPTTPLPDKKLLVFILDRLQKKDTRGVFSEPVDPDELPDYHEVIEHPMDFGTVRKKLDGGAYLNLEELEADVLLICSNAMQYNSSDTVYFRQARSIQELARRDFDNLRNDGEDGKLQPKVVRRGRPPGKHPKRLVGRPLLDRVAPETAYGVTLATAEDSATESTTPYNLRKGPTLLQYHSADGYGLLPSQRLRNNGNYSESSSDWNNEFPASILRADMKHGKKLMLVDDTRRETYRQSASVYEPPLLPNVGGDTKQLMTVGLHVDHSYARSLARFAANLGPVAWKIASKKIERALPPGTKFGPGWVGGNEAFTTPPPSSFFSPENQGHLHRPSTPSLSGPSLQNSSISSFPTKEECVEVAAKCTDPQRKLCGPSPNLQTPHGKLVSHHGRNGLNGLIGLAGLVASSPGKTLPENVPSTSACSIDSSAPEPVSGIDSEMMGKMGSLGKHSWQRVASMNNRKYSLLVPPDLNVGLQGLGSPGSGLIVGSPQQPDLALQL